MQVYKAKTNYAWLFKIKAKPPLTSSVYFLWELMELRKSSIFVAESTLSSHMALVKAKEALEQGRIVSVRPSWNLRSEPDSYDPQGCL